MRVLKAQYEELQQIIATVDQTVEPRSISRILNEEAINMTESMRELEPGDGYVLAALNNAMALQEELIQEQAKGRVYRIRESDSHIALTQKQLEKAAVLLSRRQALGLISPEELNSFRASLAWARLMISVLSYVAQGHQATNRGEVLPAKAYYQRAKSALAQSSHPDKRRTTMIRELKEIIANRRVSLSEELMPETDFNPDIQPALGSEEAAS
ncbi:hypothetical protein [Halioxenophilus sp. WMMB6]|uniref:hypothetical protein n=1 Tax=Halioxenophilus sp. WMMB6 TaxID=3073815 RepID=UPI00295E9707|nr:hypothetical protein [Halioxenophilus sp. WMMB6]